MAEPDFLNDVYDLIDEHKYAEAIALAKQEAAKKNEEDEFLFRRLIGKALLDDYFLKKKTQPTFTLSEEAYTELNESWKL